MLKLAIQYSDELNKLFVNVAHNDKYKFFNTTRHCDYDLNLAKDSWSHLEFVSVDKNNNVLGFLSARIDRHADSISSLRAINFHDLNYTFSKDFHQFIRDLFEKFNFRKINFSVVVGNPAEKMYDKYINQYKGRVVGIYKEDVRLFDGNYYDFKLYEIMRSDYLSVK